MRSLGERLNLLRKLINIKCGPGAAILPPEVTRVHVNFAKQMNGGHMGARKFWQENLPRIKYHNPSVPIIVNRHTQQNLPPLLTIYLRKNDAPAVESRTQPASSRDNLSPAPAPAADERVVELNMKEKPSAHILEYFLAETRAVVLKPSAEEIKELQELEALKKAAEVSRERVKRLREEKKREEDMLKRARAAGGVAEEEEA